MEAMGSVFRIDQSQSLHTASPKIRIMAQCQSLQIVVRNGAGSGTDSIDGGGGRIPGFPEPALGICHRGLGCYNMFSLKRIQGF